MKKWIAAASIIITSLLFTGCFYDSEKNGLKETSKIKQVKTDEGTEFVTTEDILGADITLTGSLNSKNVKSENLFIVSDNNNKISVAGNGKGFKAGDVLFTIDGEQKIKMTAERVITEKDFNKSSIKVTRADAGFRLLGDFNGNNVVDLPDFIEFSRSYGTFNSKHDISPAELGTGSWAAIYSISTPDGKVDLTDFITFAKNYSKEAPVTDFISKADFKFIRNVDILAINEYSASFEVTDSNVAKIVLTAEGGILPKEFPIVNKVAIADSIKIDSKATGVTVTAISLSGTTLSTKVVSLPLIPPDTVIPVITLIGSANISMTKGSTFTDPGYTATDDRDGDVASLVQKTGTVNTDIVGTYVIKYNVTDKAGNKAAEKTRTISITDTVIPVVTGYVDNSKNYNYTRNTFPIGGGVDSPIDYTKSNIFVDLIKTAAKLGLPDTPWSGTVKVDSNGWPLEDFGAILFRDQYNIENKGTYKMSFECSVIPVIKTVASSGVVSNLVRNSQNGIVTGDLSLTENQVSLFISFTNTNGGVKNLKILRPGYTEKQTFTKEFLDHMDRYSTIRTMDFTLTNNNMQEKWSDRKKPTDGFPNGLKNVNGASWEYCVELANTVKADLWINIPHLVDAEYIKNLATLIKNQLDPDLNLYFEYSNENWNWMFSQTTWFLEKSKQAPYNTKLAFDGETNQYYLQWRLVGEKLKESVDIFASVWGQDAINKRVRPVLASQIGWGVTFEQPLKYLQYTYGDVKNYVYGVAGAPYFNLGDTIQSAEGVSVDQMIAGYEKSINETLAWIEMLRGYAKTYGVKMLAYEGGSDSFGPGSLTSKELLQSDPRLKNLIIKYLENWYFAGGELFCWYVAGATSWNSQYGAWGLINTPGKDIGPKIEAIDAIIAGGFSKYASGQIPTTNPQMNTAGATKLIDFNELTDIGIQKSIGTSVASNGYTFKSAAGLITLAKQDLGFTSVYPSIVLHGYSWGSIIEMEKTDGKPFSLKSAKLLRPYNVGQVSSVKITAYFHTNGYVESIVNIPLNTGRNGLDFIFPSNWVSTGMKKVKFEFLELENATGAQRFGAIDDLNVYETVLAI